MTSEDNKPDHEDVVVEPETTEAESTTKQPDEQPDYSESVDDLVAAEAAEPKEKKGGFGKLLVGLVVVVLLSVAGIWGWQQFGQQSGDDVSDTPIADSAPARADAAITNTTTEPQPLATGDIIERASLADVDALKREIDALREQLATLSNAVSGAERGLAEQSDTTASLQQDIQQRVDLLDSLPGRVRNNEEALSTLQGISAGSRRAWLIAEAEYYLQIANAQMQLANNPALAAAALDMADQRVRELADPAFTAVRRKIREELAALKAINQTDIEGVTLTLGSLAAMVPGLPLEREDARRQSNADIATNTEASGWARVKQSTSDFFAGMVRIRDAEPSDRPMLSPDAEYFLRLNLQLQLQAARLSLLLGESASFQQTLQDAETWLADYFSATDAGVIGALEMLADVRDTKLVDERPDISGSLTLLRQLRDIGSAAE